MLFFIKKRLYTGTILCSFLALLSSCQTKDMYSPSVENKTPPPKKILIYSTKAGGGQESIRKALEKYLGTTYRYKTAYIFNDVLWKVDISNFFFLGKSNGEGVYNYMIRNKYFKTILRLRKVGEWCYRGFSRTTRRLITQHLKRVKPDLIISLVPIVNDAVLYASYHLNIPFLLIPCDLDITGYVHSRMAEYLHPGFHISQTFIDKTAIDVLQKKNIPLRYVSENNFLVRPEFLQKTDIQKTKNDFNIPPNKPVLLLMMGAAGSYASYTYMKKLATITFPLHVVVVLGRNEKLRKKIDKIPLPSTITTTIIGFTNKVADLMQASDLCITKPGPNSIHEALYSELPLLLDMTSGVLQWEQANVDFVQQNSLGGIIKHYRDTPALVTKFFTDPAYRKDCQNNAASFKKVNAGTQIKKIVETMITSS